MEIYDKVVSHLATLENPTNVTEVSKALDVEKKEVEKVFTKLKKEEKITSPIRCKWELKK